MKTTKGNKKTATALTITIFLTSPTPTLHRVGLPRTYKRRSTTTKPRLAYTGRGALNGTKVKLFAKKEKLMALINDFRIDTASEFIKAIGECFPQQVDKEKRRGMLYNSKYQLLDFSELGVKILFRISDHNINCANIKDDIEEAYSIALKSKKTPNTFRATDVTATEYVFFEENNDRHRYRLIARALLALLETGEWDERIAPADAVNHSPRIEGLNGDNEKTAGVETCGIGDEFIITIEKFPADRHPVSPPQGDYAPYKNCHASSQMLVGVGNGLGDKGKKNVISKLTKLIESWNIADSHTFALSVSSTIGAHPSAERVKRATRADEISFYLELPEYSLRIGLHNVNASNYKGQRNRPQNYGVTLKERGTRSQFYPQSGVNLKEYVYRDLTKERLRCIAEAILHLLETGEWDERIAPADAVNHSPRIEGLNGEKNMTLLTKHSIDMEPVTYETLPQRIEEVAPYLTKEAREGAERALQFWHMYDDAEFRSVIDDVIMVVNAKISRAKETPKSMPKAVEEKVVKPKKATKTATPKTTARADKPQKAANAKVAKVFEGEWVEVLPEEVRFIVRYSRLNGKTIKAARPKARNLLAALQKAIVEKRIRKTSKYAKEIMTIQKELVALVKTRANEGNEIAIDNLADYKKIAAGYKVMSEAKIVKAFLAIEGKTDVEEKARKLQGNIAESLKAMPKAFASEIDEIKQALDDYLAGRTGTPSVGMQTLRGLMGIVDAEPEANYRSGEVVSSEDFAQKRFRPMNFEGEWQRLIGNPSEPYKMMIYGNAGSGKSTLALRYAHYLASVHGERVLYVADEEKLSYTLQEKLTRIGAEHPNLWMVDRLPKDLGRYDVVFLDSVSSMGIDAEELRRIGKNRTMVYVFQCTKDGRFLGKNAFGHDVDVIVKVEHGEAVAEKNRFGGKGTIRAY